MKLSEIIKVCACICVCLTCHLQQEAKIGCKELEEQVNDFMRDTFTLTQEKAKLEEDIRNLQDKVMPL